MSNLLDLVRLLGPIGLGLGLAFVLVAPLSALAWLVQRSRSKPSVSPPRVVAKHLEKFSDHGHLHGHDDSRSSWIEDKLDGIDRELKAVKDGLKGLKDGFWAYVGKNLFWACIGVALGIIAQEAWNVKAPERPMPHFVDAPE